MSNKPKC